MISEISQPASADIRPETVLLEHTVFPLPVAEETNARPRAFPQVTKPETSPENAPPTSKLNRCRLGLSGYNQAG